MWSASQLFYLSIFALWGPQVQCQNPQDACAISPRAIVSDACASYSTLERLNSRLKPAIDDVTRSTDFFSHYRLNLFNKKCPFWNDDSGMCGNIACAVETLDNEEDIPEVWRASELGKLEGPLVEHPNRKAQKEQPEKPLRGKLGDDVGESCVVEYDDECDERDYCVPDDESASAKGDYVSLLRNPERFTGYAGAGAAQVWGAIYRENCFSRSSFPNAPKPSTSTPGGGGLSGNLKNPAAMDFRSVLEAAGRQQVLEEKRAEEPLTPFVAQTGLENEDECLEKRVFYRVISGMHASISTHLCWDFLNQTTGQWQPNLACYESRLHRFPDRISNLYFNYALVTRAIAKLGPHLSGYTFCTGDLDQDAATRAKVLAVTQGAASVPQTLDESLMFKNGEGPSLKDDFRNRFRNVSRLMDCVGCDKCRLWGKLQTAGYGTALKVLFEFDNSNNGGEVPLMLKRTELVALFNTYARLSSSLSSISKFKQMIEDRDGAKKVPEQMQSTQEKQRPKDSEVPSAKVVPARARKPHHVVDDMEDDLKADKPRQEKPVTLNDELYDEVDKVYRAFRFVIKQWISFPFTMWQVISSELMRLWQFYIGMPVSPREWSFHRPNIDEL